MAKIHITEDGPKLCTASKRACPLGSADEHYESFTQATIVYETRQRQALKSSLKGVKKEDPRLTALLNAGLDRASAERALEAMGVRSNAPTALEEIKLMAKDLLDEDLEFPDHSSHSEQEWVKLSALTDPKKAGNNCFAATTAISDYLATQHPQKTVEEVEVVMSDGTVHWATEVEGHIIDFTFSQFKEDADFPLVAPKDEWLKELSVSVKEKYGITVASH